MSNTNSILKTPISDILKTKKVSKNIQKLFDAGLNTIEDYLWVFPLRIYKNPSIKDFSYIEDGKYFRGKGKLITSKAYPAYGLKGKGKIQLFNINVVVKDLLSEEYFNLKWFNSYPNIRKQITHLDEFIFFGQVTESKGQLIISNPKIETGNESISEDFIIEYPTINSVPGKYVKGVIDKIPNDYWDEIDEGLPLDILKNNDLLALSEAFKFIHGKIDQTSWDDSKSIKAKERLIFEEFFSDQLKILTRKKVLKLKSSSLFQINQTTINNAFKYFPYVLTEDQIKAIEEICEDLKTGHPMMRMIQGDVGCGKTSVAMIAAYVAVLNNMQVAVMAPTETLAKQHTYNFTSFFKHFKSVMIDELLGSHKPSEKKIIYNRLENGETNIIIGTHSLFQDKVIYKNLGLVIIDEQHKFGVEQRLRLLAKGKNPHCIIMTATPIPRTLRLTQFGDLDITLIKQMPKGRKGTKTRIVTTETYDKFLSFIKTRISLEEQIYIVVPAIEESETIDIKNINEISKKFKEYFPEYEINQVHGKLKSDEKEKIINDFKNKKFPILVSTSVIEVGIDIPNATVMAIYNPERFGLSSLHQLRGRVGRGAKPGFCFLVADKELSLESLERLRVMENTTDGFKIAEEDLKFRGEGDLFGTSQSGQYNSKRIANAFIHSEIFEKALKEIEYLKTNNPDYINKQIETLMLDEKIISTI